MRLLMESAPREHEKRTVCSFGEQECVYVCGDVLASLREANIMAKPHIFTCFRLNCRIKVEV